MKQEKSGNNPANGVKQKTLVTVKDVSCSLVMIIPTEGWDDLPYHRLVLC